MLCADGVFRFDRFGVSCVFGVCEGVGDREIRLFCVFWEVVMVVVVLSVCANVSVGYDADDSVCEDVFSVRGRLFGLGW